MKLMENTLRIALMATLLGAGMTVQATVINFTGEETNALIPTNYASNVASADTAWEITNGATPNVALNWTFEPGTTLQRWDFYNDGEWAGVAQMNDFEQGTKYMIEFTPEVGYGVIMDSFVFDDYVGWGEETNDFSWALYEDSTNGTVIVSGSGITTDGQNLLVETGMAEVYAGTVVFAIYNNLIGFTGDDQAIDDVTFRQEEIISDPSTILGISATNGVMRMVIDAPGFGHAYWPKAKTDLVVGSWVGVPHSLDGAPPWYITNLSYVAEYDASGTNEVIYLQASDAVKFFGIGDEQ